MFGPRDCTGRRNGGLCPPFLPLSSVEIGAEGRYLNGLLE